MSLDFKKLDDQLIRISIDNWLKQLDAKIALWKVLDESRTPEDKGILLHKAKDTGKPDSHA